MKVTKTRTEVTEYQVEVCDGCGDEPTEGRPWASFRVNYMPRTPVEERQPDEYYCHRCLTGERRVRLTIVTGDLYLTGAAKERLSLALRRYEDEASNPSEAEAEAVTAAIDPERKGES